MTRFAVAEGEGGGGFGGVEQLSRYLHLLRRDTLLGTVSGILAAQLIKPQARLLERPWHQLCDG